MGSILVFTSTRILSNRSKFSVTTQLVTNHIAIVGANYHVDVHGFGFLLYSTKHPTKHFSILKGPCSFIHSVLRFSKNLSIFKHCLSIETSFFFQSNIKTFIFYLTRKSVRLNYESVIVAPKNHANPINVLYWQDAEILFTEILSFRTLSIIRILNN
jgi:hypothetical protein